MGDFASLPLPESVCKFSRGTCNPSPGLCCDDSASSSIRRIHDMVTCWGEAVSDEGLAMGSLLAIVPIFDLRRPFAGDSLGVSSLLALLWQTLEPGDKPALERGVLIGVVKPAAWSRASGVVGGRSRGEAPADRKPLRLREGSSSGTQAIADVLSRGVREGSERGENNDVRDE